MPIIEVRNVVKKYGDITAVAGLNLDVNEGECFGLLGPNGAGKTSLIRMITCLSPLNSGDIRVDGRDIRQQPRQIKAAFPEAVMIFILPPTAKDLAERLNHRGREGAEAAEKRLNEASSEIAAAWQYYEQMVINEDLQQAVNECMQIIKGKKS